ncbi:Secreted protein containing C-terminal beta-propeller domain [Paenibacillus sp. yr247]|uniref:beta-propeller domain-containing protein n=1 Tax=Paenibacillus sp. yr247 TaxID=1761880 RepID=UPI00088A26E2|nr:beta-propeller domain-containing protein [Paenibacillus sp. yr247]SDO74467.1 Secreted protein containing C-terminal beta-propeller domain [Paenibacillus sp. yr247]
MKKWLLPALLIAVLLVTFLPLTATTGTSATSENEPTVNISLFGEPMKVERPPILVDGVTLVPLRNIAEALGAELKWHSGDQTIEMKKGSTHLQLAIGSESAQKNGQLITLETAPRLVGSYTMVPARFISESFDMLVTWDSATNNVNINHLQELPLVGSLDNLRTLLEKAQGTQGSIYPQAVTADTAIAVKSAVPSASTGATVQNEAKATADYSTTNTQVAGVNESDVVKTDGTYIYQVNREQQKVLISKAYPSTEMKLVSMLDYKDFSPNELYVDDKYLIVIGNTFQRSNNPLTPSVSSSTAAVPNTDLEKKRMIYPGYSRQSVKAYIYDIADKANPKQVRDLELDGSYVSSRKIGSSLYLIANEYVGMYHIMKQNALESGTAGQGQQGQGVTPNVPGYKDSAVSQDFQTIDYKDIRYFPNSAQSNYMLVAGLDLNKIGQGMNVSAYLVSGHNVYASDQNLFVAVTKYTPVQIDPLAAQDGSASADRMLIYPTYEPNTSVYKFKLDQGAAKFVAQGEVPGTVLNQFSMDEHNGHFRIATTKGHMWATSEKDIPKNNVYILNEAMQQTGKLEDIAPGERIYSARFLGNRAYMVTFKNVDPLFALDLSNPSAPKILGALKIPGYSDYLHPYDENHLIGFGKDTIETALKGGQGIPDRTTAFYLGMKVSLFDVTDVSHPVEKFKEVIGDRGTESDLLHNQKALLFSRENNLLAFPVRVMEVKGNKTDLNGMPAYGQFSFQGAYVYNLDLQNGFKLKGKITHMTEDERLKAGNNWFDSKRSVERILYIKDTLYTLSPSMIKTNEMLTLKEKDSLLLP